MGLPGCGKTSWAREFVKKIPSSGPYGRNQNGYHLEHDDVRSKKTIEEFMKSLQYYLGVHHVVLDTLVLSNESIKKIIDLANISTFGKVVIHYWEPNREACLINDRFRRNDGSEITIKNAVLEEPNILELKEHIDKRLNGRLVHSSPHWRNIPIEVVNHTTERKPDWKIFMDEIFELQEKSGDSTPYIRYSEDQEMVLSSDWCTGGTWGDCWGNHGGVSGSAPEKFTAFDTILELIAPDISFLKYKKIKEECVNINEYGQSDYYGGSTTHSYWYFKVSKFYEILKREGIYKISV